MSSDCESPVVVAPMSPTVLQAKSRIYIAGPMFNEGERWELEQITSVLEQEGYATFLPHRDGMVGGEVTPLVERAGCSPADAGRIVRQGIFDLDVYEVVEGCSAMLFSLNGRVPDEGAAAEAGLAYGFGKPIVLFKKDWRSVLFGRDNPLILGLSSGVPTVEEVKQIPTAMDAAIKQRAEEMAREGLTQPYLPPNVRASVIIGRKLASIIRTRNNAAIAAALVQQYASKPDQSV